MITLRVDSIVEAEREDGTLPPLLKEYNITIKALEWREVVGEIEEAHTSCKPIICKSHKESIKVIPYEWEIIHNQMGITPIYLKARECYATESEKKMIFPYLAHTLEQYMPNTVKALLPMRRDTYEEIEDMENGDSINVSTGHAYCTGIFIDAKASDDNSTIIVLMEGIAEAIPMSALGVGPEHIADEKTLLKEVLVGLLSLIESLLPEDDKQAAEVVDRLSEKIKKL